MNGRMLESKPIYVALAQLRDIRKAQLEQQYNVPRMASAMAVPPQAGRGPPIPGMFPPQPQFQPQFYGGPGPMGPPPGRPNGPGLGQMYPPMVPPRNMAAVSPHVPERLPQLPVNPVPWFESTWDAGS